MGVGRLFARPAPVQAPVEPRAVDLYGVLDVGSTDWGSGSAGYRGGMSIPGAWRAATLLSGLLGGLPWVAYRERAGQAPEKVTPTPSLLDRPAPPDVRVVTFSALALDLVWHGNAVAVIATRDRLGWPTSIVPVSADVVGVRRARYEEPYDPGQVLYDIAGRTFTSDDVIHVKGVSAPGALRGMGVLENHLNSTLQLASDQARQARQLQNQAIPSGVITVDDPEFNEEDARDLKTSWQRAQRDRTVQVVSSTTSFQPIAWNPTETQLLDARRYSLHEIALIFGIDPTWLGVSGDSMTYSNIESQAVNLLKFSSLSDHLQRFEQTLTAHLPRGTWAKASLDALLRGDTLSRYQAHKIGIAAGFLTVDEARELEDRPPLTPAQREALKPPAPPALPAPAAQDPPDTAPDEENAA